MPSSYANFTVEVMMLRHTNIFETRPNDIWAMGVTMIEVIQEKSPWVDAATPKAGSIWRLKTREARAQKIKTFFPSLSTDLANILGSVICLEDDRLSAESFYRAIAGLSRFRTSARRIRSTEEVDDGSSSTDEDGMACFYGGNSTRTAMF
jgi:hypothetical protein